MSIKQGGSELTQNRVDRRNFIKKTLGSYFYCVLPFKKMMMNDPIGVTVRISRFTVKETIDRLQAALEQVNATIYARINQSQELEKAGHVMPPLEFILFGNPKAGGPAMMENPAVALDLPLKVIAWQDEQHIVHVAYNDAMYVKDRYFLSADVSAPLNLDPLISKILS